VQGETLKGALDFEHAGMVQIELKVGGIGDRGPAGGANPAAPAPMSGHGDMPMDMPMQH
jgi:hypothetical protein